MDEIVLAALRKWPSVPHCHGWLALDARGDWYMRDDAVQRQGAFPVPKGSRIEHDRLIDFIGRNYACDEYGAWFFQNGPQRVYVDLESAPWVLRWPQPEPGRLPGEGPLMLRTHTGVEVQAGAAWLDEAGRLYVSTPLGLGIVHTQDMHAAGDAVESGRLVPVETRYEALVKRSGFTRFPRPPGG